MTGSSIVGDRVLNFMSLINNVNPILFSLPLIRTDVNSVNWLIREKAQEFPEICYCEGNQRCFLPLVDFEFLSVQSIPNPWGLLEFAPLKADVLTLIWEGGRNFKSLSLVRRRNFVGAYLLSVIEIPIPFSFFAFLPLGEQPYSAM